MFHNWPHYRHCIPAVAPHVREWRSQKPREKTARHSTKSFAFSWERFSSVMTFIATVKTHKNKYKEIRAGYSRNDEATFGKPVPKLNIKCLFLRRQDGMVQDCGLERSGCTQNSPLRIYKGGNTGCIRTYCPARVFNRSPNARDKMLL